MASHDTAYAAQTSHYCCMLSHPLACRKNFVKYAADIFCCLVFLAFAAISGAMILGGRPSGWAFLAISVCGALYFLHDVMREAAMTSREEKSATYSAAHIKLLNQKAAKAAETTKRLVAAFDMPSRDGEPIPPWFFAPEYPPGHPGWRMGKGETYLYRVFYPFWDQLAQQKKEAYFERYDLGAAWPDRDLWRETYVSADGEEP